MLFYNDLSIYSPDTILTATPKTSHSGPELAPKSVFADKLALEVVLDKITLAASERPAWTTGEDVRTLILKN